MATAIATATKMSIGSDPEFMLANTDGQIISAIPVLKNDKYDKIDMGDGYVVYYDNVMLETNVPAAHSKDEFLHNIRETYSRISEVIGKGYQILATPSYSFTKEECRHPHAREAGCSPEFDAYEKAMCMPPSFKDTFRSAGGHIHIGRTDFKNFDEYECDENEFLVGFESKPEIIKAMDLFFGVAMVLLDNSEASIKRKILYGKGGRFRPTYYGAEYRTPSNYWLSSPGLAEIAYDCTDLAYNCVKNKEIDLDNLILNPCEVINNDNTENAKELIATYMAKMDKHLAKRIMVASGMKIDTLYKEWKI